MTDANPQKQTTGADRIESAEEPLPVDEATEIVEAIVENVQTVIVGHREVVEHVIGAQLAGGHVLLEDVPGVGKTMLARAIARSVDCSFKRVQFTPDLLPSDITGVNVFNQKTREFQFNEGPVFANVVLGDEINRAPPKTQSALLEAMEEEQVTVDGDTRMLPQPFTVIATQNAVEPNQTYELPLAELDRFMKHLELGYPNAREEAELIDRITGDHPIEEIDPVTDLETLRRLKVTVANVTVREPVREYVTRLANHTREHATIGVSPRGTITLIQAAQARAVIEGREYVRPDDIKREAPQVLAHRIRRKTGAGGESSEALVRQALQSVPVE